MKARDFKGFLIDFMPEMLVLVPQNLRLYYYSGGPGEGDGGLKLNLVLPSVMKDKKSPTSTLFKIDA